MELTWVAIAASICMGLGAACIFIFAVQKDYFHNIEDVKYQVFWQEMEDLVNSSSSSSSSRHKEDGDFKERRDCK
jgi:hypothetical protein